jgi:hypothetical protein
MVKYWLRWLAVLPGAALAGVLATIPLHLVLYMTLSSWIEPYPELPERLLGPFAVACAFVVAGARIAPDRKIETSIVLLCIWVFMSGGFVFLIANGGQWLGTSINLPYMGLPLATGIVGAGLAVVLVKQIKGPEGA